ncbi:GntP family permease [Nocardioides sp. B-3]|nr:GntP family permease [Nocardioides sp. B-3]UUZ59006.1 GntP family permease [Nocardioides sp. B-3]
MGNTPVALLISLLVAIAVLGRHNGTLSETMDVLDKALGPICSIILITGAGGMFGGVLRTSGIGDALTSSLSGLGLPLLLRAFLIATALRVARGSATVALTTTAGLIATRAAGLDNVHLTLLVVAIAAGLHRALARQRLRLLAGEPVLRDGREDHAQDHGPSWRPPSG